MPNLLQSSVMYLKGVGETRALWLQEHLNIATFGDLLHYYPYRYDDKTNLVSIKDLHPEVGYVLLKGNIQLITGVGNQRLKRIHAQFFDGTGSIELVWFNGLSWLKKSLKENTTYYVYGKPVAFQNRLSITHPELEAENPDTNAENLKLDPVYTIPDKLRAKGFTSKILSRYTKELIKKISPAEIVEIIPDKVLTAFRLPGRYEALINIHHPQNKQDKDQAVRRLKFEELFLDQVRLLKVRAGRKATTTRITFPNIEGVFQKFYAEGLPFELTGAQKKVLREIRKDVVSGHQMNRLLQGDVGSGKTLVALMSMLMATDNNYQACLMAPTEILARQHFATIQPLLEPLGVQVGLLTGQVKGKQRKELLESLANGSLPVLIGTHALIEDQVQFKKAGLVVIDEQHRFGVEQRARLWTKNEDPPHILVMTATPIPRTLAMTYYGDLDTSVIDELPPGRKPIQTIHYTENMRLRLFGFMKEQIALGRQIYMVYPIIEESEKLDLNNLMEGYSGLERTFPRPAYNIGIVHGKMPQADKDFEMKRFVEGKTHILVATTVIEVGVNVPNATIMVIENAERFGLAQLHQLRGRVGRGSHQSFCVLMTSHKLSQEARTRIKTMCETNDGFRISEVDMQLRGPGEVEGTRQSGAPVFQLADLKTDMKVLEAARQSAMEILEEDPDLRLPENAALHRFLESRIHAAKRWGRVS